MNDTLSNMPPPVQAALVEQCVALLRQLQLDGDQFVARLGHQHGLHRTDLKALAHIAAAEAAGASLSPGQLALRLELGASAVTSVLDRLEAVGHTTRVRHGKDRRRTELRITASTREKLEALFRPLNLRWAAAAATYSEHELSTIVRFLGEMDDVLRSVGADGSPRPPAPDPVQPSAVRSRVASTRQ